jgi:hypothetical protein
MAWITETGAGSNRPADYHELVWKIVAAATSQHVATVAVNAAGTGYVVGDVLTLTHAGAAFDARFEVTTVGGSGDITGLRIVSSGAFANRLASAAVAAGGSGYAVGDVLEVQGGSAREKAKVVVATLSGSAVATVTVAESGGAYATPPGSGSATVGVGPNAYAGDDAATLNPTMTGLIGTTGLSVTGGTGSAATVDITLAETGWAVDDRNTDNVSFNGVTNEKEVVLVGDATGRTNKPYIGLTTLTRTNGLDTRYGIALHGMTAHNPAIALSAQPALLGTPGTWSDSLPYLVGPENQAQEIDLFISIDDVRLTGVINANPGAATTTDGAYLSFYMGYLDSLATEAEAPYPMFIHGACRSVNVDPANPSTSISSMPEFARATFTAPGGHYFFFSETQSWRTFEGGRLDNSGELLGDQVIWPSQMTTPVTDPEDDEFVPESRETIELPYDVFRTVRQAAVRRWLPIPGSTAKHYPLPFVITSRDSTTFSETLDLPVGQLRGCFWVFNSDASGNAYANFAEDYLEDGSDRYRVFQNHRNNQRYNFFCIKEDV